MWLDVVMGSLRRELSLEVGPESMGFPGNTTGKEPTSQCRRHSRCVFDLLVWKIPWRRKWQPTPVFLPGESHEQRSLRDYGPQGYTESDTTEVTEHARRK